MFQAFFYYINIFIFLFIGCFSSLQVLAINPNDKKMIERYDRDKDGKLSEEELKEARSDIKGRLNNCRDKLKKNKNSK